MADDCDGAILRWQGYSAYGADAFSGAVYVGGVSTFDPEKNGATWDWKISFLNDDEIRGTCPTKEAAQRKVAEFWRDWLRDAHLRADTGDKTDDVPPPVPPYHFLGAEAELAIAA